jgi:hypothetical protein
MHSAIFVAVEPSEPTESWLRFIEDATTNKRIAKHGDRLAKGVFLVRFRECPAALASLISFAEQRAISYRILPLAEAPQWIPADDPS